MICATAPVRQKIAPIAAVRQKHRAGAVWGEKNCTDRTSAKKIAPITPVRRAQLQVHWCDGSRTVAELLCMAL